MKIQEYVAFVRTPGSNRTILPKYVMTSKSVRFLVKKELAHKFPKRGISWLSMHMADFVFADGVMIKNIYGPY